MINFTLVAPTYCPSACCTNASNVAAKTTNQILDLMAAAMTRQSKWPANVITVYSDSILIPLPVLCIYCKYV